MILNLLKDRIAGVKTKILPSFSHYNGLHYVTLLNTLVKKSFRKRENLQYMKMADSVLLNLFLRTNGMCNNSHVP